MTEDEMTRWHHRFNGHEFEQAPGDDERQGSLMCCSHAVSKSWTQLSINRGYSTGSHYLILS